MTQACANFYRKTYAKAPPTITPIKNEYVVDRIKGPISVFSKINVGNKINFFYILSTH